MSSQNRRNSAVRALPRLCGADIELGNFIRGVERAGGTGYEASRALLAEISGYPSHIGVCTSAVWPAAGNFPRVAFPSGVSANKNAGAIDLQDVGRRYLAGNGGSAYIDLNHIELAIPEVVNPFDHVAACHAMLRIARAALDRANARRDETNRIQVLVNNTDGLGRSSYGSHLNFLITRRTFDNIFRRKAHYLQFLASFQVSAILLTGQGKVGAENGRSRVDYQISQRADFFEALYGLQTTFDRPIVNSRDEPLCGVQTPYDPRDPARLHVIFFDSALAHGSALFRVGLMQLIVTLIELDLVNPRLILEDPLEAVLAYSHDATLQARARLIHRGRMTALELQSAYLDEVMRHAGSGVFDEVVPRAGEVIALWEDTLVKLANRDFLALARRLDWVCKLVTIEGAISRHPGFDWTRPEVKMIDHLYSSLDEDGLFWACEAAGQMERLVSEQEIWRFVRDPPDDSRAWTRAMLLRRAAAQDIAVLRMDWDTITFKVPGSGGWPACRTIDLPDPLALTRSQAKKVFDTSGDFDVLIDRLQSISANAHRFGAPVRNEQSKGESHEDNRTDPYPSAPDAIRWRRKQST